MAKRAFSVVLSDIEGTTTPISFVANTLFPYIRRELSSYLHTNWGKQQLTDDIQQLRALAAEDKENNIEGAVEIMIHTMKKR